MTMETWLQKMERGEIDPTGRAPNEPGAKLDASKQFDGMALKFVADRMWIKDADGRVIVDTAMPDEPVKRDPSGLALNDTAPVGSADSGQHYRYSYRGVKLDPYRVIDAYGITHPAQQHAIKKLLRAGKSVKSLRQDIQEVQDALTRWLEMLDEDQRA